MDDEFTVNPDEAFQLIPEGEYEMVIASAVKKQKEGKEWPYIEVKLHPTASEFQKMQVTDRLSLNPAARWRLARLVKATGLAQGGGEQKFSASSLVGQVVLVRVKHEEYRGMPTARPDRYSPVAAASSEAAPAPAGTAAPAPAPAPAPASAKAAPVPAKPTPKKVSI